MISENTAQLGGSYMSAKWSDLIAGPQKQETRTEEEIKAAICAKLDRLGGK